MGEDRNSLAAVENEMLAIADTHQGVRLVMAGQREQGIDLLLRAARMGSSEAMYNLGVIYQQDGKESRAARFYQAASEMGYAGLVTNSIPFFLLFTITNNCIKFCFYSVFLLTVSWDPDRRNVYGKI